MTGIGKRRIGGAQLALRPSLTSGITLFLSALLLWFVLQNPTAGADAARRGLLLCAQSVIPALLPFFVLSGLLTESGLAERAGHRLSHVTTALLGVSGSGAPVLLLGLFCGFPVGARVAVSLHERGALSKRETERLFALSNGPSFAFLYSAVGAGFFGDGAFGLRLYFASVCASLLSGVALRLVFGKCEGTDVKAAPRDTPPLSSLFTSSVVRAGETALTVSVFVVFFTVLSEALSALTSALGAPPMLSTVLTGLLELSRGSKNAAETVDGLCGKLLCGFFAGWGGLCAHLQVIATAERRLPDRALGKPFSFRSYFVCKILQGLLTALVLRLLLL